MPVNSKNLFLTVSSEKLDWEHLWPLRQKRSECLAVFTRIAVHQPFERLELTVLKNSSSVRTVRAMRSTKLISRSNGSSYPFEKIHQPFERLELSVRENSSAVWTARAIRSRKFISRSNGSSYPFKKETVSYFDDFKTINSPFFVKWCMPSCLHYTNSRHASVLCLPPLKWYSLHFLRKNVLFTSSY